MDEEEPEKPKKRRRWLTREAHGRAKAGLGYFATKAEKALARAEKSAAAAFLAHRDPWDEVKKR